MIEPEPDEAPETGEPPAPAVTASGYPRRVRGTQLPRTDVVPARSEPMTGADGGAPAELLRDLVAAIEAGAERARSEGSATHD